MDISENKNKIHSDKVSWFRILVEAEQIYKTGGHQEVMIQIRPGSQRVSGLGSETLMTACCLAPLPVSFYYNHNTDISSKIIV